MSDDGTPIYDAYNTMRCGIARENGNDFQKADRIIDSMTNTELLIALARADT